MIMRPRVEILAKPSTEHFNAMLEEGRLLKSCLKWIIIQARDNRDRNNCDNHRPVILTSIVRYKIFELLEVNKLLTINQHGFRQKRSCFSCLVCFLEGVTIRINRGLPVDVFHLNLQRAFNPLNHGLHEQTVKASG